MPHTHGVIAVGDLQGASVTVTITDERAEQPTVYTDESGESAADNPATVTEATRFHVGRPGSYTVVLAIGSVPVGGGTVYLDGSEASFAPAVSAVELAQYLGGGGGGGGASGALPIAEQAAWTVDTSTYTNSYDSQPLTTLVGNVSDPYYGYECVAALAFAGDAFPRLLLAANALFVGDGTFDPMGGPGLQFAQNITLNAGDSSTLNLGGGSIRLNGLSDDITFEDASKGPIITDQSDGHTYRIISTNGVLSTEQVS